MHERPAAAIVAASAVEDEETPGEGEMGGQKRWSSLQILTEVLTGVNRSDHTNASSVSGRAAAILPSLEPYFIASFW